MYKKINIISNFNSENIFQVINNNKDKFYHYNFKNIIGILKKNKKISDLNIILFLQTNLNENEQVKNIIRLLQKKFIKSTNILIPFYYNLNQVLPISSGNNFFTLQKNFSAYENILKKVKNPSVYLIDFFYLSNLYNNQIFNLKRWYLSKNIFTPDFELFLSEKIKSIINLIKHKRKKAIFVDLDDTLWGGTIAEDNYNQIKLGNMSSEGEAFQNFQELLKEYTKSGIILGIISRNYERKALKFISSHPEMILKKKDFAGWKINFKNKSENIKTLCKELNLKVDNIIFIDNSEYERQEVKGKIKEVEVLNIGDNVFDFSTKLKNYIDLNFLSLSKEDFNRAENYSKIRSLKEGQSKFKNHEDWLKSLKMKIKFESYNEIQIERYHQMYNKINQINLSTRRFNKGRIKKELSDNMKIITMRVEDKVVNLGIIGLISYYEKNNHILIGDFLFSCRALGRNLEKYFIKKIVNHLISLKSKKIVFNFKKTPKNELCTEILNDLKINKKNKFTVSKKINNIYKKNIFQSEINKY